MAAEQSLKDNTFYSIIEFLEDDKEASWSEYVSDQEVIARSNELHELKFTFTPCKIKEGAKLGFLNGLAMQFFHITADKFDEYVLYTNVDINPNKAAKKLITGTPVDRFIIEKDKSVVLKYGEDSGANVIENAHELEREIKKCISLCQKPDGVARPVFGCDKDARWYVFLWCVLTPIFRGHTVDEYRLCIKQKSTLPDYISEVLENRFQHLLKRHLHFIWNSVYSQADDYKKQYSKVDY